jgi:two-component sensor histidine kinase
VSLTIETHQRRLNEEKLKDALKVNQMLMGEIHHRVKNNLQILISLLRIERNESAENETRVVLEDIERRMVSIVKLHEKLYANQAFVEVDICQCLCDLSTELAETSTNVTIATEFPQKLRFTVPASFAVNIGLITSEAVSNSLKHAFKGKPGIITVKGQVSEAGNLTLSIHDNGEGMAENIRSGFGMELMEDLTRQQDGELHVDSSVHGTTLTFLFPAPEGSSVLLKA